MKRIFAFQLSILCASLQLVAQQSGNTFSMERLGTKDGLSHRWMTCIHQDIQGCFWMGTYDGLNRYDGNEFIVYRPSAGGKFPVKADFIYQIAETADGKFYISTLHGILSFDPQTGQFDLLTAVNKLESVIILNSGRGAPFLEAGILHWAGSTSFFTFYDLLPSGKLTKLASTASLPFKLFPVRCNKQMVDLDPVTDPEDIQELKTMIERHAKYTGSQVAERILSSWNAMLSKFIKVFPKDYKRVLEAEKRVRAQGLSGEEAVMAAFQENVKDVARVGGN